MIRSVFGHMKKSLPEEFLFWGSIFCAISASDFRGSGAVVPLGSDSFSHEKGHLSGGGVSRQASFGSMG